MTHDRENPNENLFLLTKSRHRKKLPSPRQPLVRLCGFFLLVLLAPLNSLALVIQDQRCEYRRDPLGIDAPQPRLSWILAADKPSARGLSQNAYQVLVASSPTKLSANQGDLWDSGQVRSDQSIQVRYSGRALTSGQDCFWKVRVWGADGKTSAWSQPAHWSMGLMNASDWHGHWIGLDGIEPKTTLTDTSWIYFPEGHPEKEAPPGTRYFRRVFELPAGRAIRSARLLVTGDDRFTAWLNDAELGSGHNHKTAFEYNVKAQLHPGKNVLAVLVKNEGEKPTPAGLVGLLRVQFEQGEPFSLVTDETWQSSAEEFPGWNSLNYDDSTWLAARNLGPVGMEPWGEINGPEDRRLPARWLRKDFKVEKKLRRAVVYFSGLGLSELYLNGSKVGDAVLSPGLTEYNKRVFYVTYDVTRQLRHGANAFGVVLGNGRFFAPRGKIPTDTRTFGFPKMLLQLQLEYNDGSTAALASDAAWKVTTNGPIRLNNEYDGETYDARMELDGWSKPGFDDSKWEPARLVEAPEGVVVAQNIEPIRVTQTLKPRSVKELKPGVYIYDLGQNMVGWCRLQVSGPRGTSISLRHAETLKPDGSLYLDNLRSAKVTDTYILKGSGIESYEPRFTYHGFRFVEVTGYPGRPPLSAIEGRVVHDDLESAGEFTCSNPLLNRIYQNIRWGVLGNYRSVPTDCPQRDERQGWLGDRSAECKGETYLFNTAALYSKWLQDMADAEKDSGSVPDVCPAYWPIYSDNVTWPSSTVIIPGTLREQYADSSIVGQHFASAHHWMDYMGGFMTNGLIAKDSYGDWCVPPEDPKLIHSKDPKRRTDKELLATAYFYQDARLMERYARLLDQSDDAQHFEELATALKRDFNNEFLDEDQGQYDNGTQTSCVLPLAFGLVPDAQRAAIFRHLTGKIQTESNSHIGTGLIGGQWLMRVLTENGRPDLAYTVAAQRGYPSWGYMVEKGATTIWELWNGDTADPAMNSGNHVMLVGDLAIWLHENLAGIKPAEPGFKHILMRPEPVGDLKSVHATHQSPFGLISSEWRRNANDFHWQIQVPVNTTATVMVPARSAEDVLESGRPAAQARGVKFERMDNGRAVLTVGSGTYTFLSKM